MPVIPTATERVTEVPTVTAIPSATSTAVPSETLAPTATATATPTPTEVLPATTEPATQTPLPSETVAPTATATESVATEVVGTAVSTPTATPTIAVTFPPPMDGARGSIDADCNYRVVQGDRLFRIGLRFNRTIRQLVVANHLADAGLIQPNQILKIPDCQTP